MSVLKRLKTSSQSSERFLKELEERKSNHLLRSLSPVDKGILFSSNDYLSLSDHPKVLKGAEKALSQYGLGSGSARTFSTHLPLHLELEEKLASYLQRERALLFSSGFQLNMTLLRTLGKEDSLFFIDQRAHRSLLEGALTASGKTFRFRHNDLGHLETLLQKHRGSGKEAFIVTESLFSMDGDRAPLDELIELKERFGALLIVDEAHSIGVLGNEGRGLSPEGVDLVVGAFGKAFGAFGGFIAGDALYIDYLLNFSPGFLFTTALPPPIVGGLIEACDLLPSLEKERELLKHLSNTFRAALHLEEGDQIVPYLTGTPEKALHLSEILKKKGYLVPAVRPPTVAPKGAILRFSLTTRLNLSDIHEMILQLRRFEAMA